MGESRVPQPYLGCRPCSVCWYTITPPKEESIFIKVDSVSLFDEYVVLFTLFLLDAYSDKFTLSERFSFQRKDGHKHCTLAVADSPAMNSKVDWIAFYCRHVILQCLYASG